MIVQKNNQFEIKQKNNFLQHDCFLKIIIPTYNSIYIKECLESIYRQDFKNYFIVIVDDCSSDDTIKKIQQITKKYNAFNKLQIVFLSKNYGPGYARNIGIINGPLSLYTWFIDSDDYILSQNCFKNIFDISLIYNYDMIYFDSIFFNQETKQFKTIISNFNIDDNNIIDENTVIKGSPFKIIKSSILKKFNEKIIFGEDILQWIQQLKYIKTYYKLKIIFYVCRQNKTSLTRTRIEQRKEHRKIFIYELKKLINDLSQENLIQSVKKRLLYEEYKQTHKRKILILTAATKNLEWQYTLTNTNKQKYCDQYKYEFKFILLTDDIKKSYHARKDLILKYLNDYDWVMWMDTDTWFNNCKIKLDDIINLAENKNKEVSLIIARDHYCLDNPKKWHDCYINSGILLFKNNIGARTIINAWKYPDNNLVKWMNENTVLNDQPYLSILLLTNLNIQNISVILDPKQLNCFARLYIDKSIFIYHVPGKKDCIDWYKQHFLKYFEADNKE